jgi:hypothetical protein
MNHRSLWPAALVGIAVAAPTVTFAFPDSPLRPAITLGFLLVCPGMAVLRRLHLGTGAMGLLLAVVVSLAIDAGLALVMVYTHLWSPPVLLVVLALTCGWAGRAELARRAGQPLSMAQEDA